MIDQFKRVIQTGDSNGCWVRVSSVRVSRGEGVEVGPIIKISIHPPPFQKLSKG